MFVCVCVSFVMYIVHISSDFPSYDTIDLNRQTTPHVYNVELHCVCMCVCLHMENICCCQDSAYCGNYCSHRIGVSGVVLIRCNSLSEDILRFYFYKLMKIVEKYKNSLKEYCYYWVVFRYRWRRSVVKVNFQSEKYYFVEKIF